MMLAGEGCAATTEGAAGFAASPVTALAGTAALTFPSLNPASCSVRLTLPSGCPTKLGITNADGSAAAVISRLIFGDVA